MNEFVKALNAAQALQVTQADYEMWYEGEGEGDAQRFEDACLNVVTREQYEIATALARCDNYMYFRLGIGPAICGGIDLSKI